MHKKGYVCIKTLRVHKDVLTNMPVSTIIQYQHSINLHCTVQNSLWPTAVFTLRQYKHRDPRAS